MQVSVGGSPQFLVQQQLGKGGFGQVFKGNRAFPRASKDPHKPMQVGPGLLLEEVVLPVDLPASIHLITIL